MKKELDKGMAALVLAGLAVVWLIYLLVAEFSPGLTFGVGIAKTVILCLPYLVLLYNAWGWSDKLIFRILFLITTAFLIFCAIAPYIPGIDMGNLPLIGLKQSFKY